MAEIINLKEVTARVFGREFDQPCNDPNVLECRMWACQKANRCELRGRQILEPQR